MKKNQGKGKEKETGPGPGIMIERKTKPAKRIRKKEADTEITQMTKMTEEMRILQKHINKINKFKKIKTNNSAKIMIIRYKNHNLIYHNNRTKVLPIMGARTITTLSSK